MLSCAIAMDMPVGIPEGIVGIPEGTGVGITEAIVGLPEGIAVGITAWPAVMTGANLGVV